MLQMISSLLLTDWQRARQQKAKWLGHTANTARFFWIVVRSKKARARFLLPS